MSLANNFPGAGYKNKNVSYSFCYYDGVCIDFQ